MRSRTFKIFPKGEIFVTDSSIKLSQAAITFELTTSLNSQKQNPHSEVARALANAIINQEYALQSSYILATESIEFLESERIKVNSVIDLLVDNQLDLAWSKLNEA